MDASVLQIAASVGDLDLETNLDRSVFFSERWAFLCALFVRGRLLVGSRWGAGGALPEWKRGMWGLFCDMADYIPSTSAVGDATGLGLHLMSSEPWNG